MTWESRDSSDNASPLTVQTCRTTLIWEGGAAPIVEIDVPNHKGV